MQPELSQALMQEHKILQPFWKKQKQLAVFHKTKPYHLVVSLVGTSQKKWKYRSKRLYKNVHSRLIRISQKLETDHVSINRRMNKLWYIHKMKC